MLMLLLLVLLFLLLLHGLASRSLPVIVVVVRGSGFVGGAACGGHRLIRPAPWIGCRRGFLVRLLMLLVMLQLLVLLLVV